MKCTRTFVAAALLAATVLAADAAVPPPPVNQYLGIPDTTFNNLSETGCRSCHNQAPPIAAVDPTYLPDRHHLVVGTRIPSTSDVPTADANGDGQTDTVYGCYNCHESIYDAATMSYALDPDFRDCTLCHKQTGTSGGTVHHRSTLARAGDCAACHGSFVDRGLLDTDNDGIMAAIDKNEDLNGDGLADGGWIPTYKASLVTPWPSRKPANGPIPGTDDRTSNLFGEKEGSCKFCHSNRTGIEGAPATEESGPFKPVRVFTNSETHHTTGFFEDGTRCQWCHSFAQPNSILNQASIRTCEICHGIPSLHNIQVDSGSDGIKPGTELHGYGHIGSQSDCDGCHGFDSTVTSGAAPASGPVVPGLYHLSASSVRAGTAIELTGTAFINQIQDPVTGAFSVTARADVLITDKAGNQTVLSPVNVFDDAIQVIIPADLPAGNYRIAARKGTKLSNPLNLAVIPTPAVTSATISSNLVTITGSGFSSYMDAAGSGTGVTGTVITRSGGKKKAGTGVENVPGTIQSWSDTSIVARFRTAPTTVDVETVFGAVRNIPVKKLR